MNYGSFLIPDMPVSPTGATLVPNPNRVVQALEDEANRLRGCNEASTAGHPHEDHLRETAIRGAEEAAADLRNFMHRDQTSLNQMVEARLPMKLYPDGTVGKEPQYSNQSSRRLASDNLRPKSQAEVTLDQVADVGVATMQELNRLTHFLGEMEKALGTHLRPAHPVETVGAENCKEEPAESDFVTEARRLRDLHAGNRARLSDIIQTVIAFTDRLVIP